jgi:uncharacterized protein YoaH (UPF0181 family)
MIVKYLVMRIRGAEKAQAQLRKSYTLFATGESVGRAVDLVAQLLYPLMATPV